MKIQNKIKLKLFIIDLLFEIILNTAILLTAFFCDKFLETLLFYIPFNLFRYIFPKIFHFRHDNPIIAISGCMLYSYLCYAIAIAFIPKINISIFISIIIGIFINFILFKLQDYIDLKKTEFNNINYIYKMNENELRTYARSKGLSEMMIDTLILKVIKNYKWVEIMNERNYSKTAIIYHKNQINKKLNINL